MIILALRNSSRTVHPFPIVIESIKTFEEDHNPKLKLNKANWDLFHTLCDESLTT